jgi:TonB-linked SusC/RagA family outer membrane protein
MKEAMQQKKLFFNRLMLSFLVVVFTFSSLSAQVKTVSGVVKDASGETIIGASIIVKGTKAATITNVDGAYNLNVPSEGKTLIVSYIGMESQEVPIKGNVINISLKNTDKSLDEVVVIGYGTQRKRDLTGSVSSVGEKDLRDIPVSTVAEALTGKLPGVQVTTTEGSPDAEIKIRVRGGGSITQSNSPLYIVDGFAKDDIKDISPSEIQSVDVLKDASSTAIYGSRGANGVIIITTKSGSQGKLTLSYNGYAGFKEVSKLMDVLSPYQFAQKQYERSVWGNTVANDYETYFGSFGDINLYNDMNATNWQKQTFGRTGVTQNHNISLSGGQKNLTFNVNYSHIDDKAIMVLSDFRRDNLSAKINAQPLTWLKVDLSARYAATIVDGSGANDQTGQEKSTSDSRVKNAVLFHPIPLKNLVAQDDNTDATASLYSPIQQAQDNDRYQNTKDFNANGGLTFNITKDLLFKTSVGYTSTNKIDDKFWGLTSYYITNGGATKRKIVGSPDVSAPAVTLNDINTSILQNTNTLNYTKKNIFPDHNISVLLGEESYSRSTDTNSKNVEALPVGYSSHVAWDSIQNGVVKFPNHFFAPDNRLLSFFGRVNYDIKDKYLLALTFRADGSSKFSGKNEWGYFPSASAGWRISDEQFMINSREWLSNLKLRGSYGASGNNNIDNSAFWRNYSVSNNNYLPVSMQTAFYSAGTTLANKDLKWETTTTRGLGLDFGFFNNRLSGSIDLYSNTTSDVLMQMSIGGVGYTNQWQNVGQTSNKGAELNLNAILIQKKDFTLSIGFNISTNANKVDNLGSLTSYQFNEAWTSMTEGSNSYIVTPGNPVGLIYGYVNDGMYAADDFTFNGTKWIMNTAKYTLVTLPDNTVVYKDKNGNVFTDNSSIDGLSWGPGAMKLKDINGDGKITDADRTLIGNTNPKHYGSFNINATYKGFDFSTTFNWVYGNNIYNANKIELTSLYYKDRNMLAIGANSYTQIDWTTGNRVTDPTLLNTMNANVDIWAAPTGRYAITSWAIEDGSFLRLNNVTLGYTLPSRLTKKFYVQKLRLYATGYNLICWTKYSGYDPEVDTRRTTPATPGVDYSAYPKSRSYNIGVNITF